VRRIQWYWILVVGLGISGYGIWLINLSNLKFLDIQLALTLIYVEVPIGLMLAWLVPILFERRSELAKQHALGRYKEDKEYLKKHYEEDLLPVISSWFVRRSSGTPLEYTVLSASAHYDTQGKSAIVKLTEPPTRTPEVLNDVIEHLSKGIPQDWNEWVSLKEKVNSHLEKVVKAWKDIENSVREKCKELGFVEWNGRGSEPPNSYWMWRIMIMLWSDPEYFEQQGKHLWDDYQIQAAEAWYRFGDFALSNKKENLDKLRTYLDHQSLVIAEIKKGLIREKSLLEKAGQEFQNSLSRVQEDYVRHHKNIPSSCSTCEEWLVELHSFGA
jgi:hypothetical protein